MFLIIRPTPPDVEIQKYLTALHIEEWLLDDVFHFKWWLLLGLILAAFFIWWKKLDKSRLPETCLYAALTTIMALGIFEWGEELILWEFPTDIIPIFPPLSSVNLIMLPLAYSFTYQYFKTWKGFIFAAVIVTAVICFVIEPVLVWVGLYELVKWKYYFSFPVYLVAAIGIRALVIKLIKIQNKYRVGIKRAY
jgi:hypothetical protein